MAPSNLHTHNKDSMTNNYLESSTNSSSILPHDVVKNEYDILKFWDEQTIWQKLIHSQQDLPQFNFFDGPPFATGLPHYGHICISMAKDCVMRYKSQMGYKLNYSFGWDCHGLPIEFEINKKLGIKTPQEVKSMGIDKYNNHCREIVMKYSNEWQTIIRRIARWTDFKNDYKTMNVSYMESVWNVFKELYNKQLVYKGFRVMPFSTGCNTPLSNFEATLDYQNINDPSIVVTFPLLSDPRTSLLAWTTTPWTLPSNLALCVHPDKKYVKIKITRKPSNQDLVKNTEFLILMECRLEIVKKNLASYEIIDTFNGTDLVGLEYVPLFEYYTHLKTQRPQIFTVVSDCYVTDTTGTGIVHQAPYFGVDDFRVGLEYNIIQKDECVACPIDECGLFMEEISDYKGLYFKDANPIIIKYLKEKFRLLVNSSESHSYPHCWRSHTPLIYKAVSSWFVNVDAIKTQLLQSNQNVNWVPESIKNGRFGNWLENAQDWLISRNRYWGCPLPLWISDDGQEIICIGSLAELEERTGVKGITDLHSDKIDHLTIPSSCGKGLLRRVPEVFDCWFESGSVPYASQHYPFENKEIFMNNFPVDFITEGIDQCRGWFYTLMILGTALFGVSPFKNCVTLGLIMAEDGQKMSKSKKNYPDPMKLIDQYGADSLRIYLTSTPVMHGVSINFKESDVSEFMRVVVIQFYHSCQFLKSCIGLWNFNNPQNIYQFSDLSSDDDMMDHWIISVMNSFISKVHEQMDRYLLYKVIPYIPTFVNLLNNWYIKINRPRLKGSCGSNKHDTLAAINTLFYVIFNSVKIMAPFLPFVTERIYQELKPHLAIISSDQSYVMKESVHLTRIPEANTKLIDLDAESQMEDIQSLITLMRGCRDKAKLSLKRAIKKCHVFCSDQHYLDNIKKGEFYIKMQVNVKDIEYHLGIGLNNQFGIKIIASANHQILARRITKQFKIVCKALPDISQESLMEYQNGKTIEIQGVSIFPNDLILSYVIEGTSNDQVSFHYNDKFLVILDLEINDDLQTETTQREIVAQLQQARKSMLLKNTDKVEAVFDSSNVKLGEFFNSFKNNVSLMTNCNISLQNLSIFDHNMEQNSKESNNLFDLKLSQLDDSKFLIKR